MIDIEAVRYNERVKLFAQTAVAIGVGLAGWAAVEAYSRSNIELWHAVWMTVGFVAIYNAWAALGTLQAEE